MKFKRQLASLCLLLILLAFFLDACRKEKRSSGWNTDLLVPIATSNLSLSNLVTDSNLKTNKDSSLTLAYQSTLYTFNIANQIVKIPDTAIGQNYNLDSLTIASQTILYGISLGTIANKMIQSGNFQNEVIGGIIIAENGHMDSIPAVNYIPPDTTTFSLGNLFDSAVLTSGYLGITVSNDFPVPLEGGRCVIKNGDGTVIADTNIGTIPADAFIYFSLPINGAFITDSLKLIVSNLYTPGSNGQSVLIDTGNKIRVEIFASDLHVSQAWAKFQTQTVLDETSDITQVIQDRKLTYIEASSGFLRIKISNSLPQPLYLQYTLVGAYDNRGQPLVEYTTVPPDSSVDGAVNISGYSINLTGKKGSSFNTYTQRIVAQINYTGISEHISLSDVVNVRYELDSIVPGYLKGYAGKDTVIAIDSAAFSFLNIFRSGTLNLQNVNMVFNVINGIGVNGQVKINSLSAYSPVNGTKMLTGSAVGQALNVGPATDFPLTPSIANYTLNNSNSNISSLLGILPSELYYNVQIRTNVSGNNGQYREFAYAQSNLTINLNAQIPLSFIANNLLLKDTVNFSLNASQGSVNTISNGTIYLIAENKYPIQAYVSVVIYDGNWKPLDTLFSNQLIAAAPLNNSCMVTQPQKSVLQKYVDQNVVNALKQGQYAVITADFSTASSNPTCNGQPLKIYSNYTMGVTLSGKFNYKISTQF